MISLHVTGKALISDMKFKPIESPREFYDESPASPMAEPTLIRTPSPIKIQYDCPSPSPSPSPSPEIHRKIAYYDTGMKMPHEERNLKGDKLHGPYRRWFQDGQLWEEMFYVDNILNGPHIVYYNNGNRQLEFNYMDGHKHGKQIMWYSDGKLSVIQNYCMGRLVGLQQSFYNNGKIRSSENYNFDGLLEGTWRHYYKNGNVHKDGSYRAGKLQGMYIEYNQFNNISHSCIYENGIMSAGIAFI